MSNSTAERDPLRLVEGAVIVRHPSADVDGRWTVTKPPTQCDGCGHVEIPWRGEDGQDGAFILGYNERIVVEVTAREQQQLAVRALATLLDADLPALDWVISQYDGTLSTNLHGPNREDDLLAWAHHFGAEVTIRDRGPYKADGEITRTAEVKGWIDGVEVHLHTYIPHPDTATADVKAEATA